MAKKLFSLYIPKYAGTKRDKIGLNKMGPWPLPYEIGRYISYEKSIDMLVVSPGYLSTSLDSCPNFLRALEDEIFLRGRSDFTNQSRQIVVGLLKGCNGHSMISGEDKQIFPPETIMLNNEISLLELHEIDSKIVSGVDPMALSDGLIVQSMVPKLSVKGDKEKDLVLSDHRKQIFFINSNGHYFTEFIDDDRMTDAGKMEAWLEKIDIKAVCIGSSNFSYSTYFGSAKRSEADLLMFVDDDSHSSDSYHEMLRREIQRAAEESRGREGNPTPDPDNGALDHKVLSETIAMNPANSEDFFGLQLHDLLSQALYPVPVRSK